MTDKLLPLPEPFDHIQTLESTGATDDVPVFTADQVRTHREEYAQAVLSANLAAQQAEPCRTCNGNGLVGGHMQDGSGYGEGCPDCNPEPAPVVGEPSEPLLRRMDAYLAGQSAEATAIIKDARAVLALRLQPASEPGGDFEQWLVDTARTPEAGVKPEQVNLMRIGWQAALRSQPMQAEGGEVVAALQCGLEYVRQALADFDSKYDRHPALESDRKAFTSDIEAIERALEAASTPPAQPVQATRSAREAEQRARVAERFAGRAATQATADFDLPAPNDEPQPVQPEPVAWACPDELAHLKEIGARHCLLSTVPALNGRDVAIYTTTPQAGPMTDKVFDLICGAIDKADSITLEGDYMLTSDDCIEVVRTMQALLSIHGITQPQQPEQVVPEDVRRDAERYRWLRATENQDNDAWNTFGPYSGAQEVDAAIDAAMLAASGAKGE